MLSKNHISSLLGLLFLAAILLTGCAREELSSPAGEDIFKNLQVDVEEEGSKGDRDLDTDNDLDEITDDEDDEDDDDRSADR